MMRFIYMALLTLGFLSPVYSAQELDSNKVNLERGLAIHQPGLVSGSIAAGDSQPWLSKDDLSISVWVRFDDSTSVSGDLLSWYDQSNHQGGHLTIKTDSGVTSCQSSYRHLQFGIDDGSSTRWQDCGVPGNALLAFAMCAHDGQLYAGTCEPGKGDRGQVYRYAGGQKWQACGRLDGSNSVTSLAVFNNQLYAGTGRYRVAGSSLPESENQELGGRVFRYREDDSWELVGQLPGVEAVGGLVVYRDQLYASSLYKPAGFFRLDGNTWTALPVPQIENSQTGKQEPMRVVSLAVHEDSIYAGSYDGGFVFKYDGASWTSSSPLNDNTQTYGFIRYQGCLLVSTWPSGRVYRMSSAGQWSDFGRLGDELEVMGMMVYNGRLMAGTLPSGQVYTLNSGKPDSAATWSLTQTLDQTPNVKYRRVWTMAEHNGELFCSTLPSGKVFAAEHGVQVTSESSFPSGWHHVVATKRQGTLELFIDGKSVCQRHGTVVEPSAPPSLKLTVGNGMNGPFKGELSELRVYRRCLNESEIAQLALDKP